MLRSLTPLPSADTMGSIRREASPRVALRGSAPCVALIGHCRCFCALLRISHIHLPAHLPSARLCCPRVSRHGRSSTMRALTPAPPRQRDRSLRLSAPPSGHPAPNHVVRPNVALPVASARSACPRGPRLRRAMGGSPRYPAESGSSSCRLPLRLRLLPTPPHGDAVAFGYMCCDHTSRGLSPR
jgi:hypothetical protein